MVLDIESVKAIVTKYANEVHSILPVSKVFLYS
jgi:hypothetical protein